MINFTPQPILIALGPVAIRYYSLAYLIAFLLTYLALRRSSFKDRADDLTLWVMVGVLLGGRLGEFIFYSPATFWADPLEIFRVWHGGMSFHGGILGCALAVWIYCRRYRLPFLELADTIVIPATVGIFLGRIANFLNGELWGTVTTVPWCVVLPSVSGCRHPSPLYEAAYTLLILLGILGVRTWAARTKRTLPTGSLLATFLILYGICRFVENFWREDARFLGISTGQYLSILTLGAGIWLLLHIRASRAVGRTYKSKTHRRKR